jgi:beta-glucosidase
MVEYSSEGATGGQAVRLGCTPSIGDEAIRRAVQLAEQCDSVVLFAGTNGEWESEGADRTTLALPGAQDALIEAVAAANPRTVVVLNTGSPVAMPWLDRVGAVVQAWFPGQESGNAIADVLFGDVNPSGKLTQTFPMRLEDNPAYINYPGENGRVHYGEGLFVGYRYYDMKRIEPLFPFGFGLSYTEFAYSHLRVVSAESPHQPPTVHADITNTGSRSGQEVVQLYVRDVASRLTRPEKELKGFAKVMLAPGETQTVTFALTEDALAYFDDLQNQWIVEPGTFELLVGASSRDIRLRGTFDWPVGGATTA